jgi:hypothetical protein
LKDDANFWTLYRHAAKLAGCNLSALADLDHPETGIQAASTSSEGGIFSLLSISANGENAIWPAKLIDTYVRGHDLVATYAGDESWPFTPQIYWTSESLELYGRMLDSLSIVVSMQTDRLDTHPRIFIRSSLPTENMLLVSVAGDELLVDSHVEGDLQLDPRAAACGIVWRLPGSELSYAEVMPRTDFRQLTVTRGGANSAQSRWELFGEFLEKGVIRRARLQALFVPRENDMQFVAECCQAIENKPLPLTT